MVRHQTRDVETPLEPRDHLSQPCEEGQAIGVVEDDRLVPVPATCDVVDAAGDDDAQWSRHAAEGRRRENADKSRRAFRHRSPTPTSRVRPQAWAFGSRWLRSWRGRPRQGSDPGRGSSRGTRPAVTALGGTRALSEPGLPSRAGSPRGTDALRATAETGRLLGRYPLPNRSGEVRSGPAEEEVRSLHWNRPCSAAPLLTAEQRKEAPTCFAPVSSPGKS
jgi:hypothetical protein